MTRGLLYVGVGLGVLWSSREAFEIAGDREVGPWLAAVMTLLGALLLLLSPVLVVAGIIVALP